MLGTTAWPHGHLPALPELGQGTDTRVGQGTRSGARDSGKPHLVIIFWLTHGRNFPILSPSKSDDFVKSLAEPGQSGWAAKLSPDF